MDLWQQLQRCPFPLGPVNGCFCSETDWPALWLNLESQTVRELSYLVILDQFLYSLLRTADMGPSAPVVYDSRSCVTTKSYMDNMMSKGLQCLGSTYGHEGPRNQQRENKRDSRTPNRSLKGHSLSLFELQSEPPIDELKKSNPRKNKYGAL